jgi:hypothetical protein
MIKSDRVRRLLKLLPVAVSMTGVASHAMALEAPGNSVVGYLGSALESGYLHGAQQIVDTVFACGVRAVVIGDVTLTVQELDLLITAMAQGDRSAWTAVEAAFQSVQHGAGATFIADEANIDACVSDHLDLVAAAGGGGGFGNSSQV